MLKELKKKLSYQKAITINKCLNAIKIFKIRFAPRQKIDGDKLFITLRNFNHGRYGFQLINYFSKAGYHIVFVNSYDFLFNLIGYDQLILDLPNISIENYGLKIGKSDIGVVANAKADHLNSIGLHKILEIKTDCFSSHEREVNSIEMPYYIHPVMNKYVEEKMNFKKTALQGNVLFYGEQNVYYNKALITRYFKMLARPEVYEIVDSCSLPILRPSSFAELVEMLAKNKEPNIFFIDADKFRIPENKWLETLSKFSFFVATPGGEMPVCHNVIEVIEMGTIPILQYNNMFHPALRDGENCLVFNNMNLTDVLDRALRLTQHEINDLKENLSKYHQQYISPASFKDRINTIPYNDVLLYFNAEEWSVSYIKQAI